MIAQLTAYSAYKDSGVEWLERYAKSLACVTSWYDVSNPINAGSCI